MSICWEQASHNRIKQQNCSACCCWSENPRKWSQPPHNQTSLSGSSKILLRTIWSLSFPYPEKISIFWMCWMFSRPIIQRLFQSPTCKIICCLADPTIHFTLQAAAALIPTIGGCKLPRHFSCWSRPLPLVMSIIAEEKSPMVIQTDRKFFFKNT